MFRHLDVSADNAFDFPMEVAIFGAYDKLARVHHASFARQQSHHQSLQIFRETGPSWAGLFEAGLR